MCRSHVHNFFLLQQWHIKQHEVQLYNSSQETFLFYCHQKGWGPPEGTIKGKMRYHWESTAIMFKPMYQLYYIITDLSEKYVYLRVQIHKPWSAHLICSQEASRALSREVFVSSMAVGWPWGHQGYGKEGFRQHPKKTHSKTKELHYTKGISRYHQKWYPFPIRLPQASHKLPTVYGSGMRMVWEASQKGVPFLGVPGNSLNYYTPIGAHGKLDQMHVKTLSFPTSLRCNLPNKRDAAATDGMGGWWCSSTTAIYKLSWLA